MTKKRKIAPAGYLTIREVTILCKHSRQWVHQRIEDGTFGFIRPTPKRTFIKAEHVSAWMLRECDRMEAQIRYYHENLPVIPEHA